MERGRSVYELKLFLSADIEGVTGVTAWSETESGGKGYDQACRQMTRETAAACRAALALGWEVVVKDGHGDARNLDIGALPRGVQLIRGWRCSPAAMMGGLDDSFDALACVGYHSPGGSGDNPLAHTMDHAALQWVRVNGQLASEFTLNALWAAACGVPAVFLSGDQGICRSAAALCPGLVTVASKSGVGGSTWNLHPEEVEERIEAGVRQALLSPAPLLRLEDAYEMEICFKEHTAARSASWYPGAELCDSHTVRYRAADPIAMVTARMFMTGC